MPQEIPFVQTINSNTPQLTQAQKVALLDDWCYASGYEDMIFDPDLQDFVPNPQSKTEFMNIELAASIRLTVKSYRHKIQVQNIVVEEPDI